MRRRSAFPLLALSFGLVWSAAAPAADIFRAPAPFGSVELVRVPGIEGGITQGPSRVGLRNADGRVRVLALEADGLVFADGEPAPPGSVPRPGDILADGEVTRGTNDIVRAWLTDPTDRYRHGILGDAIEAGGLALERTDGRIARYKLDAGSVFEDRRVRLIDLDGDGRDEAIVVQSYLDEGAALAVFGLSAQTAEFLSEVPAIGRSNRWLNPLGAADFDGDGVTEIAYVETPHIGGTLRLFEFRDRKLRRDHSAGGFSNHGIGSRVQDLGAVYDWTGDGVPDIAVPDARRRTLRFVTFAQGKFTEFETIANGRPIVTAIRPAILDDSGDVYAVYGLEDGTMVAVRPTGDKPN